MTRRTRPQSKPFPRPGSGVFALLQHESPVYKPRVEKLGAWRPYVLSPGYQVTGLFVSEADARASLEEFA